MRNIRTVAVATAATLAVAAVPGQAAVHHLITGNDVKNSSLTSADIKDLSLHAQDFDKKVQKALKVRAQRRADGAVGATGAKGDTGAAGTNGKDGAAAAQGQKADKGDPGATGQDGQSIKGDDGLSAYVIWQQSHPNGTEADFLAALKGDK